MLPKISLVFDRKHNRKVEACVYYAGKRRYLATGITVPANAEYRDGIISGCPSAPSLNKMISTAMGVLMGQLQEQVEKDNFDVSSFSLSVTHNTDSFTEWAISHCSTLSLSKGSVNCYKNIINKFAEHGVRSFSDVTTSKMQAAVDAMKKEMSPISVRAYSTIFLRFARAAKAAKLLVAVPEGLTLPKGKGREICYLTHEELEKVENTECTGRVADSKDMFLFACYTGLAYSDIIKIKKSDIIYADGKPYIIDRRQKTKSRYKLRLLPKAMDILERHGFNMNLHNNNRANEDLIKIEKAAGISKHLSMHVGRHTFATLALSSGVRIETVSRMLAHADITTTQIYAKVLQKDVDEGFDILEGKI